MSKPTHLAGEGSSWFKRPGASADQLDLLARAAIVQLPESLVDLLRFSNGGEGSLPFNPYCFVLDPVDEIIRAHSGDFETTQFPGFVFIGSNGGLERFALDTRGNQLPYPVVMVDPIAGISSVEPVATSFDELVDAIGRTDEHE